MVLTVSDVVETRESIAKSLSPEADIKVVGSVVSGEAAIEASGRLTPDVVVLDVSQPGTDNIRATERIVERSPGTAVIMISSQVEADYVRRAMAAGARGFVVEPYSKEELIESIHRAHRHGRELRARLQPVAPAATGPHAGHLLASRVVAVFSPKGGVGRTTLAVNLAVSAIDDLGPVALVDANIHFGDVGLLLELKPNGPSIADLVGELGEGLAEAADAALVKHKSGLHVLLAPPGPETAELITPEVYRATIDHLRQTHRLVIVDCGPALQDLTLAILDQADVVLVVTSLDLTSIKTTRQFLAVADRIGYTPDKLRLVLNRSDSPHGIGLDELEGSLGRKVDYLVVSDGRAVLHAMNNGVPFALGNRQAQISQDVAAIAAAIAHESAEPVSDSVGKPERQRRLGMARR